MDEDKIRMIDPDLLRHLETMKKDIMDSFKATEDHIKEMLQVNIDNIKETVDRHSSEIFDLYQFDRDKAAEIAEVKSEIKTLKGVDDHQTKTKGFNIDKWAIAISAIIAIGAVIVAIIALV